MNLWNKEEQLGTGHAVMITEPLFTNPDQDVLILCGDVPLLSAQTLIRIYEKHKSSSAACTVLTAFLDEIWTHLKRYIRQNLWYQRIQNGKNKKN